MTKNSLLEWSKTMTVFAGSTILRPLRFRVHKSRKFQIGQSPFTGFSKEAITENRRILKFQTTKKLTGY